MQYPYGTDSHNLLSDCYRRHGKDTCIPSTDSSSPQRRTRSRCDIPAQQTQSTDCSTKQGTCFPGFSKWNHYRHWDSLDQKSANPRDIAPLITSITWYKPTYHVMHLKKRRFCDLLGMVQWNPMNLATTGPGKIGRVKNVAVLVTMEEVFDIKKFGGVTDIPIWRPVVQAWSLPSCCFLRQETLFHIVSLHPGV